MAPGSTKSMAKTTLSTILEFFGDENGEARREAVVSKGALAELDGDAGIGERN
jgi:hypothetical protein